MLEHGVKHVAHLALILRGHENDVRDTPKICDVEKTVVRWTVSTGDAAAVVRLASMDGRMTAAVAGHPLPIVVRADGAVERIGRPGSLLGVFPDPTLHDVGGHLHPGDLLILYTDGLTDARHEDDRFGEERLVEIVSLRSDGPEELVGRMMEAVTTFAADDLSDDIALLVARRR